jgi:hypothetical protein
MEMDIVVSKFEETVPEMTLQQSFFQEQLNLIFEMRRDITNQWHHQKTLHHRLDMLVDSFSRDTEKKKKDSQHAVSLSLFLELHLALLRLMGMKVLPVSNNFMFTFIFLNVRKA